MALKRAELLLDVIRSLGRKAAPAREEDILRNVAEALPEMLRRSDVTGGFSFNPRTGRFREGGYEAGDMMATVAERLDDAGNPLNRVVPTKEMVLEMLADPYYMDRLRRGQYLGGWVQGKGDDARLVLDPAQRFLSRDRSIVRGARAGQEGGFGLRGQYDVDEITGERIPLLTGGYQRSGEFYPLTPELVSAAERREAARKALAAIAGGGSAGYLGTRD